MSASRKAQWKNLYTNDPSNRIEDLKRKQHVSHFYEIRKKLLTHLLLLPEDQEEKSDQPAVYVCATPKWKKWVETHHDISRCLRFTNPGYFYFSDTESNQLWKQSSNKALLRKLHKKDLLASEAKDPSAMDDRVFMKQRVILTEVTPYRPRAGDAKSVSIITGCGPNLMGSSPKDLKEFSIGTGKKYRTLKSRPYKNAYRELANLICVTAKNKGKKEIVIPANFGTGAYIKTLNKQSKILARKIVRDAFAVAAKRNHIRIKGIISSRLPNAKRQARELTEEYRSSHSELTFQSGNFLDEMREAQPDQLFLNPGSDRTIGGKYIQYPSATLEEQIAQEYNLIESISAALNPKVKEAHNLAHVQIIQPPVTPCCFWLKIVAGTTILSGGIILLVLFPYLLPFFKIAAGASVFAGGGLFYRGYREMREERNHSVSCTPLCCTS